MNWRQQFPSLKLFAIATLIVSLLFADVVFLGKSLQPSNIQPLIYTPPDWKTSNFLPVINSHTAPYFGFGDLGAAGWQSEPARHLLAHNFQQHESPYWNPYSAAGTVGPETLVDEKFSVFTLVSAWLFNSSAASFDFGLLLIFLLGSWAIITILHRHLQLGLLAAIAGGVVFLLNGYATPNLNSQNGYAYFISPLLLLVLLNFKRQPTQWNWIALTVVHAVMLTFTMLPTLVLAFASCYLLAITCRTQVIDLRWPHFIGAIVVSMFGGLLLTAFLWLPILHSFAITDLFADFQSRSVQLPRSVDSLLSLFTPKHFWENYSGMLADRVYPDKGIEANGNVLAYTGIIAAVVSAFALGKKNLKLQPLIITAAVLLVFSYARIFGLAEWVNYLPVIRSIGLQYWGTMSAPCLTLLVAFGLNAIQQRSASWLSAIAVVLLCGYAILHLYFKLGWPGNPLYAHYLRLVLFQLALAGLIIFLARPANPERNTTVVIVTVLMVVELLFYLNTVRPQRFDAVRQPPPFIEFLQTHLAGSRVINLGMFQTLYPEYGAMYGIKQLDSQNPARLPWYCDFYNRHFGSDTGFFLTLGNAPQSNHVTLPDVVLSPTALAIANVKYILVTDAATLYQEFLVQHHYPLVFHQDHLAIYENTRPAGTAALVPALLLADHLPDDNTDLPNLQATTSDTALLARAQALGIAALDHIDPKLNPVHGTVTVSSYHNTEILIATAADRASILALSEVWHPDWKATVDGQPAYIGRINEAFRGIALPAGKHQVRVYYDNPAVRWGIRVSIATGLLLLLLGLRAKYGIPAFPWCRR